MRDSRQVVLINLDDILPNRFQPRIKFDEKAIVELSESIKEHGVIQPIIVRSVSDKYEIIAGERRYKASVMAGKSNIPAIIVDLNDKDSSEIALIENVQRQDLTPIEEAISYRKILDMGYLTQEALANKLGVAQSTIANKLRLLNLDDEVQEALLDGKISERHARSLLRLSKSSMQRQMLQRIINERLTVRKTDEEINAMNKTNEPSVFDSIENNEVNNFQADTQVETNTNENPFIINQSVTTPDVDKNVEVLDFGFEEINPDKEAQELNNLIEDNQPEEVMPVDNQVIPNNPIVEDKEVQSVAVEEPIKQEVSTQEINQVENEQQKPVGRFFTMFSNAPVSDQPSEPVLETSNVFTNTTSEIPTLSQEQQIQPANEVPQSNIFNSQPNYNPMPSQENISVTPEVPAPEVITPLDTETLVMEEPIKPQPIPVMPAEQIVEPVQSFVNIEPEHASANFSLRDVINAMRKCADEIEAMGYDIDTEEFDFDDIYQVIFKIRK